MSRDDTIHYTIQLDVADGKMDEFSAIADEAIAHVKENEPGCLVYRWDVNGSSVRLHERFADEAAMMLHAQGPPAQEYFPKLLAISTAAAFDFHGDVSDEALAIVAGFGGTQYTSWKGYDL